MRREFIGAFALIAFALILAIEAAPQQQQHLNGGTDNQLSQRSQFKLPKLFDFDRYQDLFNKLYRSTAEQLVRQKLFMARAFRSFVSAIKYKFGLSDYYLKVNSRSDRTNDELAAARLKTRLFESLQEAYNMQEVRPSSGVQSEALAPQLQVMDSDTVEGQLREIEAHAGEPGYSRIIAELEDVNGRRKRDTSNSKLRRQLSLDDLTGRPEVRDSPDVVAKIVSQPESNNPNYIAPEVISFGASEPKPLKDIGYYTVISEAQKEQTGELIKALFTGLADQISKLISSDETDEGHEEGEDANIIDHEQSENKQRRRTDATLGQPLPQSRGDQVYVDHRRSNCFSSVRDQGECGSCYAFAFTAQLEWMHCKETGELVPFSEQYIIDCGPRTGLLGCSGGDIQRVAQFAQNFGVELRTNYPYRGVQDQCPYEPETEPEKMGYMRLNIGKSAVVPNESFEEFLHYAPMLVGVATNGTNFEEYGGGVASGEGCPINEDHAMLLVGHGLEEGKQYWLLRNSHSTSFGEDGYYKLWKRSGCIRTPGFIFGSIDGREFKLSPQKNDLNDENIVKKIKGTTNQNSDEISVPIIMRE